MRCTVALTKQQIVTHGIRHVRLAAHRLHAACFDFLCDLTQYLNYTQCVAQYAPVSVNFKFQMHIRELLVCFCFVFQSHKVQMCAHEIHT